MGFVFNYIRNMASMALGQEPSQPLLFSYYVTHRCELNCRYCCDGDGKRFKEDPIQELSTKEVKKVISILRGATDTLDITGGEPMIREDLEEILSFACQIGFRTVLNTKGIGIDHRPDLMRYTSVLVLSLDTLDPCVLSAIVGRPQHISERIIEAFYFALSKRKETGTKLVLSVVATPSNLGEATKLLRFASEHSIAFHISPEIIGTTVNPELRDNVHYDEMMSEVMETKINYSGILGVPAYLKRIRDFGAFRCHPLLMPTIRPDGRMYYPCLESKRAEINLLEAGNYHKALRTARDRCGHLPACRDCCHVFCHMAISLFQEQPWSALKELKHWRG